MLIVGIGGTFRPGSSSEVALRIALRGSEQSGARTMCFTAADLQLPFYDPRVAVRRPAARRLVEALAQADGVIVSSPGYHGSTSGLIKNALDYAEDLADSEIPYLGGKPFGCIGVARGWQAAVNTVRALRDIAHSLRAWPTPYAAVVNTELCAFQDGACLDDVVERGLTLVGEQAVTTICERRVGIASVASQRPAALDSRNSS
jgi:FMN reductase